jgi:hypothetical protein
MRDREAAKNRLKIEVADLEAAGQVLREQLLDAVADVDGHARLPFILDGAERLGARQELKNLLRTVVDDSEWSQDPEDQVFELPAAFAFGRPKSERPDEPCGSSGRSKLAPWRGLEPRTR